MLFCRIFTCRLEAVSASQLDSNASRSNSNESSVLTSSTGITDSRSTTVSSADLFLLQTTTSSDVVKDCVFEVLLIILLSPSLVSAICLSRTVLLTVDGSVEKIGGN